MQQFEGCMIDIFQDFPSWHMPFLNINFNIAIEVPSSNSLSYSQRSPHGLLSLRLMKTNHNFRNICFVFLDQFWNIWPLTYLYKNDFWGWIIFKRCKGVGRLKRQGWHFKNLLNLLLSFGYIKFNQKEILNFSFMMIFVT